MAADANVILSAVVGKAALKVFTHSSVRVVSTVSVLDEVREYLPKLAESYGLAPEVLKGQFRLLTIREYVPEDYKSHVVKARNRMMARDPDDVDLLALALSLGIPVWSNDNDFEEAEVEWYTTAELLAKLGLKKIEGN